MKKSIITILLISCTYAVFGQQRDSVSIIPRPLSVKESPGTFFITKQTGLTATGAEAKSVARTFNYYLKKRYGFELKVYDKAVANAINLNVEASGKSTKEGYGVKVSSKSVNITGDKSGVFYGCQSLLQLIHESGRQLIVPCLTINDKPNFAYRGLMLDVGRHFTTIAEIEKILDVMAYLKLNKFHWHLTDDQGWRIEIKKYPKLTAISAWRDSTIVGGYGDFKPFVYDGERSGGFYTQEQAKEIVKYAADRNIEVIPEIEMPGHSTAVLAAYPELGNDPGPYHVPGYWGVHKTIYNPGEATFTFLEDVLTEVMAIFPSKYIHIGGDEVPKDEWKTSALAQQLIKANGLKDENELQSWFIKRIEVFLNKNGRNLIGWDEILEGGLSPNATVMSWRGEQGGIQAAKESHNVIMTPGSAVYLDHAQAKDKNAEPLAIGGYLPLNVVYNYSPLPAVLTPDQQKYIMGVQGNMWTEYVPTANKLEYMIFPRAIALAEVGWTATNLKNYDNFSKQRLPKVLNDIEKMNINFRIPEADTLITRDPQTLRKKVTLFPLVGQSKIYYTVDGHKADNTATLYTGPFTIPYTQGRPVTLRYVEITPGNRASTEYSFDIK